MLKSVSFWRKLAIAYWKLYGRLHRGWRREYADYLRRWNGYKKNWREEKKKLICLARKYHPQLLRNGKLPAGRLLDFWLCYAFLGARADTNYYHFLFPQHGWRYRCRSVTNRRTRFAAFCLNSPEAIELTGNKMRTAECWADWFKRGYCLVSPEQPVTPELLRRVLGGADRLIVKPNDDYGGHGIFALDVRNEAELASASAQLNALEKEHIIEPYIRQTGLLHDLNPSSLNTVRVVTGRHCDGRVEVLLSYCRIGHAGSIVDNATSGGQLFFVDHRDGRIGEGMDFMGRRFREHLDSGETITGLQIPRWEEAMAFCISAHEYAPEGAVLVGWDVCISEDGLCLIEVNSFPAMSAPLPWQPDPWGELKKLLQERDRRQD